MGKKIRQLFLCKINMSKSNTNLEVHNELEDLSQQCLVAVIDNIHLMGGWCVSFPALSIEIFQA